MAVAHESMLQDILNLEIPLDLQLSPDCNSVVYTTLLKWQHKTTEHRCEPIRFANIHSPKSATKLTDGAFYDRMPKWSPQGGSIAFLSDRGGERGKSVALYLLALGGDEPRAITPTENERRIPSFSFSPDGKSVAYISTAEESSEAKTKREAKDDASVWGQDWDYAHLYLVDIEKGTTKTIFNEDRHVNEFAWSDDSTRIALITHETPHIESHYLHGAELSILDIAKGEREVIAHTSRTVESLIWSGSTLYFVANNILDDELSGYAAYAVNDSVGSTCRRVYGGDDCCVMDVRRVNEDVVIHAQNGFTDELRLLGTDTVLLSQKKRIRHFDARRNDRGDVVVVLAQGDVNNPTEVFSLVSEELRQLSNHGAIFQDTKFGRCTFVECQTFDGKETIGSVYLTPAKQVSKPLPTLVLLHGGPYGRFTDEFDSWNPLVFLNPLLLMQGYGILMPNYRGSSGRGQRFSSYSRGGMGIYDEPDVVAITDHVVNMGLADADRLVVGGWSQGGYLSYLSSVRNGTHGLGWRFRGAICGAGVTDWDAMALTSDIGYEEAAYAGSPPWRGWKKPTGSALHEFQAAVDEKRIPPMLILHGEKDQRVPVSQAHGFRRALDEAGLMNQTEFVT
jgi:dipeptidyl aminopeptidase/acylaminoacyl peptidase